ncbi:hypothetical protein MSPP1_001100 [Malassezia sp. CBS 17886]|nr:hypothetical protein MSPP1_001100 [Malassezia sp. CBS 17886]
MPNITSSVSSSSVAEHRRVALTPSQSDAWLAGASESVHATAQPSSSTGESTPKPNPPLPMALTALPPLAMLGRPLPAIPHSRSYASDLPCADADYSSLGAPSSFSWAAETPTHPSESSRGATAAGAPLRFSSPGPSIASQEEEADARLLATRCWDETTELAPDAIAEWLGRDRLYLNAETQRIDRILSAMAERYMACNPGCVPGSSDVVHALAFAMLLLNTDVHIADTSDRMTQAQFVQNTMSTVTPLHTQALAAAHLDEAHALRKPHDVWPDAMLGILHDEFASIKQRCLPVPSTIAQDGGADAEPTLRKTTSLEKRRSSTWAVAVESALAPAHLLQRVGRRPSSRSSVNSDRGVRTSRSDAHLPLYSGGDDSPRPWSQTATPSSYVRLPALHGRLTHAPVTDSGKRRSRRRKAVFFAALSDGALLLYDTHDGTDGDALPDTHPLYSLDLAHAEACGPVSAEAPAEPPTFSLRLAHGPVHQFHTTDAMQARSWTAAINASAALITQVPLHEAQTNADYGWKGLGPDAAGSDPQQRASSCADQSWGGTAATIPIFSRLLALRPWWSGAMHASAKGPMLAEWTPPHMPLARSALAHDKQREAIRRYVAEVRAASEEHTSVRERVQARFAHDVTARAKALGNWQRRRCYLDNELRKFLRYENTLDGLR